ncbi:hypothetical protein TNCV_3316481 [Trichonephila clavipes]|nr:hypothetical protein TNCV_3316481 [Trichonephila clavipes]
MKSMASLQGLPPLPKSLSGLLNFSSAQWKEMERLHTMRTMIQQDLSRGIAERTNLQNVPTRSDSAENIQSDDGKTQNRSGRLDVQLALLRKEMYLRLLLVKEMECWHDFGRVNVFWKRVLTPGRRLLDSEGYSRGRKSSLVLDGRERNSIR